MIQEKISDYAGSEDTKTQPPTKENDIPAQETGLKVRRVLHNIVPPVNYGRKTEAIADSNPVLVALTTQIDELHQNKEELEKMVQNLLGEQEKRGFELEAIRVSAQTSTVSLQKLLDELGGTRFSENHLSNDNRAIIQQTIRLFEGIQRI